MPIIKLQEPLIDDFEKQTMLRTTGLRCQLRNFILGENNPFKNLFPPEITKMVI